MIFIDFIPTKKALLAKAKQRLLKSMSIHLSHKILNMFKLSHH